MDISEISTVTKLNEELPSNWYICDIENEPMIKIKSINLCDYFITIQEWKQSYLVIPYIPSKNNGSTYQEEQQRLCHNIDDAFFHAKLLIGKWNRTI